jgi:hypothetical protein
MIRLSAVTPFAGLILALALLVAAPARAVTSSLGRDGGRAVLRLDGQPVTSGFVEIYYYPGQGRPMPGQPEYGDPRWVEAMRRAVDTALAQGLRLVMASVWWSDIDRSPSRPPTPGQAAYDFAPLDAVMDYAARRGAWMVLKTSANHFLPGWWRAEQGFPQGAASQEHSACRACETDAYGTAYANPSLGNAAARRDFGAYLEALVTRYRSHPALAGWAFGLGPTGEDAYGPNYIVLDAPGGGAGLGRRPMQFTDYSPDFTERFRSWLVAKYGTDAALGRAWGDPKASLSALRIPPPAELVRDPSVFARRPFPDPAQARPGDPASLLTPKGLDFYAFRVWVREDETDYFARRIKSLDPGHVLLLNAQNRASARDHPSIDGIFFNPHPRFGQPLFFEYNQLDQVLRSVETIVAAGKLAWVASENGHEPAPVDGRYESKEQINYLLALGCGVKSLGGTMGYALDLLDAGTDNHWLPTWFSPQALDAARAIEAWKPAPGRGPCETIRELRRRNGCEAAAGAPAGCRLTELALRNYCRDDMSCDADRNGRISEDEFEACRPATLPGPPGTPAAPGPWAAPAGEAAASRPPAGAGPGAGMAPSPGVAPGAPGPAAIPAGKCGDGLCDDFERTRGVCPQDCPAGGASSARVPTGPAGTPSGAVPGGAPAGSGPGAGPASGAPGPGAVPAGKCGDGLCDDFERSHRVCPQDCPAGAPPGAPAPAGGN